MEAAEQLLIEAQKRKTNHILHLLLSILTAGLWVIVWIVVAHNNTKFNQRLMAPFEPEPEKTRPAFLIAFGVLVLGIALLIAI